MKILAVGDIHTKIWILEAVEKILDEYDHVVFCGDYADDWNRPPTDSTATWRCLKALINENPNKVHAVIGNHDFAYLHPQIAGRSTGFSGITYALINDPDHKELKNWLLTLPIIYELDGVTFSHAGITEEWDGEFDLWSIWQDTSPIWARPREFGGYVTYKNIPQVIGHNPSEKIWNPAPNVWCIDTFSTYPDGTPIGDQTVLEIIDGEFKVRKLDV